MKKMESGNNKVLFDLNERIKEMQCLYKINALFRTGRKDSNYLLKQTAEIIPEGWQFPGRTSAQIHFDDLVVRSSSRFIPDCQYIEEDLIVGSKKRGSIKVIADAPVEPADELSGRGFLPEEIVLLKEIASNIGQHLTKIEDEVALKKSEIKFRKLFDYSPLPKAIIDFEEHIELVNKSFIEKTGYQPEHIPTLEQWWFNAYPDSVYREKQQAEWKRLMRNSTESDLPAVPIESKIRCKNGTERIFSIIGHEIGGKVLVVFTDLTEQLLATEELQRSNYELEQFAYVASHDLQQPLRMVSSYTELLEKKYKNQLDEKADKYIHYAVDGAKRMQELINDLLDYSRVTTKGQEFMETDLNKLVEVVLNNMHFKIKDTGAAVHIAEMPLVKCDPSQISRVFQNLIENALKFTSDNKPVICITVNKEKKDWVFAVKDNGIGIDPKFREKVFVIFQRLHHRDEYPGSGIGLSICKRILNRHGGDIWFDSEKEKGTTFYFNIPRK